ncbi:MAG TPA: HAMP domain-containing sensor histidine kinase [Pseudonocardiaceae bacterium]|nr:HAMP domain-containing sensor histidine kinase [Pseudonocardiaceae bacterium]
MSGIDAVSLRRATWRLGLQIGSCVAAIVVVLSGLAVLIVLRGQDSSGSTLVQQAALRADDVTDPPAGVWLVIRTSSRTSATPGLPPGLPDTAALDRAGSGELDEITVAGNDYRLYTVRRDGHAVQAVMSLRGDHEERERLLMAMLTAGGLGLALAVAAGVWFGHRAVRPMAAALALQRRFVADASHELRTPLTLLSTRTQLLRRHLRRGVDLDDLAHEVDGVAADSRHLADILDDLLLAADTRAARTEDVDLVALTNQATEAARPAAAQQGVVLTVRSDEAGLAVHGSRTALRRALTAMLDNAVRHAGSTVTVVVRRTGTRAVVEVTDDGPGVAPEILPHVFERFASTGETGQRRYGIGLALVGEIAARHRGDVSATNAADGGAVLALTLPVTTRTR